MRLTKLLRVVGFFLSVFLSQGSVAVVYEVTTAQEFQAALSAASGIDGSHEILLKDSLSGAGDLYYEPRYGGGLKITGDEKRTLEELNLYVVLIDVELDLTVENLDFKNSFVFLPRSGLQSMALKDVTTIGAVINPEKLGSVVLDHVSGAPLLCLNSTPYTPGPEVLITNTLLIRERVSGECYLRTQKLEIRDSEIRNFRFSGRSNGSDPAVLTGNIFSEADIRGYESIEARNNTIESGTGYLLVNGGSRTIRFAENRCLRLGNLGLVTNLGSGGGLEAKRNLNCSIDAGGNGAPVVVSGNVGRRLRVDGSKGSNITIRNNTFQGIEISGQAALVDVTNNIVWGDCFYGDLHDCGQLVLKDFPDRSEARNNIVREMIGYWRVDEKNLISDPKLANVKPLDYEAAIVHAGIDYHLTSDSPAIDAGTNSVLPDLEEYDLDGNSRLLNGVIDIGAYERNTTALHPADTNGDFVISSEEFESYNSAWRANDIWPTSPEVITADFVTRAGYLLQKGGDYKNIGVGKPQTWVPVNE
jgi:hypothetical protein